MRRLRYWQVRRFRHLLTIMAVDTVVVVAADMAVRVIGTAVAGMLGLAVGTMVVTAAAGELGPAKWVKIGNLGLGLLGEAASNGSLLQSDYDYDYGLWLNNPYAGTPAPTVLYWCDPLSRV